MVGDETKRQEETVTEFLDIDGGRIAYDPDFPGPRAAGAAIAAAMPPGLAAVAMIEGAGHHPHAQCAGEVAALMVPFLERHAVPAGRVVPVQSAGSR
jgi:hypothetical protein